MIRTNTIAAAALGSSLLAGSAAAEIEIRETLVHSTTTSVSVELNEDTVLCSSADYVGPVLKVLIPELATITLLDHQNIGAGAPCVAAGACAPFGDFSPDQILDPSDPEDTVEITVTAVREDSLDHEAESCDTILVERVDLEIRGTAFAHIRRASLGFRTYADCLIEPPDDTAPSDDPSDSNDDPSDEPADQAGYHDDGTTGDHGATDSRQPETPAGCQTSDGSSQWGFLALAFLGLAVSRRRKSAGALRSIRSSR